MIRPRLPDMIVVCLLLFACLSAGACADNTNGIENDSEPSPDDDNTGDDDTSAPTDICPFQVNEDTLLYHTTPDVALDGQGRFVISWEGTSYYEYGPWATDIYVRAFDTKADPLTEEFQANVFTDYDQYNSTLEVDEAG